jgi:ribosome-associated toxin RatA of RatAB toxin-antitoxin module
MQSLEHSTLIEKPLKEVYALARQVERYPEFLPGYIESRILERHGDKALLSRAAKLDGRILRWTSWVSFRQDESMLFEQAEGPLKGMRVRWDFTSKQTHQTQVTITHRFHIARPRVIGWLKERFIFRPKIDRIASQVVAALKQACETGFGAAV